MNIFIYECLYLSIYVCVCQNARMKECMFVYVCVYVWIYKQGVSRLFGITAGGDFLGLCDQKSSYIHVSDFGRLRSYDRFFNSRTRPRVNRVYQVADRYF